MTRFHITPAVAAMLSAAAIAGPCEAAAQNAATTAATPLSPQPSQEAVADSVAADLLENLVPGEIAEEAARISPALISVPDVFNGFRRLHPMEISIPPFTFRMKQEDEYDADRFAGILFATPILPDEIEEGDEVLSISEKDTISSTLTQRRSPEIVERWTYTTPDWIKVRLRTLATTQDIMYRQMVADPANIDYLAWHLPVPPAVVDDGLDYAEYISRKYVPEVRTDEAVLPKEATRRLYWLHTVGAGLQLSQAYISSNWYQGGNNYLALLFNFNWDVALNTVYKPNLMFTSSLAYKLAINSNQKEALHSYSISQDLLQYNLKAGVKAFKKWFYSFNLQFKTQIFNSYPADSPDLAAAFLSPADLNMGIGMTYNTEALDKRLKLSISISPASYNLKACRSDRIDVTQFNILPGHHTRSEVGSNAEVNLTWDITSNINWKSRLFFFTDYKYFQADWENTFTFNINKFLSTQLYIHPRYDSSASFEASKWHYWQLKEILSFGLSYTFSTKP